MSRNPSHGRPKLREQDRHRLMFGRRAYKPLPANLEAVLDPASVAQVKKKRTTVRRSIEDYEEAKRLRENDLL